MTTPEPAGQADTPQMKKATSPVADATVTKVVQIENKTENPASESAGDSKSELSEDTSEDKASTAAEEAAKTEGDKAEKDELSKNDETRDEAKDSDTANDQAEKTTNKDEDDAKAEDISIQKRNDDGHKVNGEAYNTSRAKNIKSDASLLPVSDSPVEIRAQVEFYFSDSNLPTDQFMWTQTGGGENRPVPLSTICNFKRMRRFQPYSSVVAALKESTQLEVSGGEGEEMIKRKKPYARQSEEQAAKNERTVYVKGFGDEEASTQFDIEAFFTNYGPVNQIRLRRNDEALFKGSVWAEFETLDLAKKFVELDPGPQWKGGGLKIMFRKDYIEEKNRLIKEGKLVPNTSSRPRFFEGRQLGIRGGGWGRGRDGRANSDDWKKRRKQDQKSGGINKNNHYKNSRGRGGRGRGGRGGSDRNNHNDRSNKTKPLQQDGAPPRELDKRPEILVSTPPGKKGAKSSDAAKSTSNGKRAREDDGADAAPPAKKVEAVA